MHILMKVKSSTSVPRRRGSRAEGDGITSAAGAGESAGGIVEGVAVGLGAGGLEHLGVDGGAAGGWAGEGPAAAELRLRKGLASAPARLPFPLPHPELRRAPLVQVRRAPRRRAAPAAAARPAICFDRHRQIVPVYLPQYILSQLINYTFRQDCRQS